jgi:cell division protein FtsI (penicillin-binding protein 3)
LAVEVPYYSCALLLGEIDDLVATTTTVASILSLDGETLLKGAQRNSSYYLAKRSVSESEKKALEYLITQGKLKGVVLEKRYGRVYPQHYHAAQVLGFTNTENKGIEGLELLFEDQLAPTPQLNRTITYGDDLYLTIDLDLQYLLDEQVVAIDRDHHPSSIVGIIMGAQTGEILASTSFPWYDPNDYRFSAIERRQNSVASAIYEPGSVFKIFSLAAELEAGTADFSQPFECDGSYTFTTAQGQKVTINCVTPHGTIDPKSMLAYSCNGAVAHWALQTSDQAFKNTLDALGFGSAADIPLVGVASGIVHDIDFWSSRTKATMAFGQEIATSALQLATAATAFATQGDVMKPSILQKIEGKEPIIFVPEIAKKNVISKQTAETVLQGMVMASQKGGTAVHSAVAGVSVAAKTGTAQLVDPTTGKYGDTSFLASTLALVPSDNPQYIIYIGVVNPSGATIWGSNIAAPAIGNLIADMVRQGKVSSLAMHRIMAQPDLSD